MAKKTKPNQSKIYAKDARETSFYAAFICMNSPHGVAPSKLVKALITFQLRLVDYTIPCRWITGAAFGRWCMWGRVSCERPDGDPSTWLGLTLPTIVPQEHAQPVQESRVLEARAEEWSRGGSDVLAVDCCRRLSFWAGDLMICREDPGAPTLPVLRKGLSFIRQCLRFYPTL